MRPIRLRLPQSLYLTGIQRLLNDQAVDLYRNMHRLVLNLAPLESGLQAFERQGGGGPFFDADPRNHYVSGVDSLYGRRPHAVQR